MDNVGDKIERFLSLQSNKTQLPDEGIMRKFTFTVSFIVTSLLISTAFAVPPKARLAKVKPTASAIKKKDSLALVAKKDSLVKQNAKADSLKKKNDTVAVKDSVMRRIDSLESLEKACRSDLKNTDSLLRLQKERSLLLLHGLDSVKIVSSAQHLQLEIQKDSLRILDSLRKAGEPDTNIVLFTPIAYDTVHHPDDSTLSRMLTKSLQASLLQYGKFQLWVSTAAERGCRAKECWQPIARRKGAGQVLTGDLTYSRDTLIYTTWMTSLVSGATTRQSQVVGYHRESDPAPRFSRIAAGQLFGIIQEPDVNEAKQESPLWRRLLLLGIFGVFAGTVVALSW